MATGAKLSIMGLYKYNPDIFSDLTVPTGIEKDDVIDNILLECYDFELVFPSYNLMKVAIRNWSRVEQPIWERLYNTENLEYNPIWNVDGDVTETREVTRERSGRDSRSITQNGTDSDTMHRESEINSTESTTGSETKNIDRDTTSGENRTVAGTDSTSGTSSNTHSQAGYNSNDLVITEKDDGTTGTTGQTSRTEGVTGTGTEDVTETGSSNGSKTGKDTEETDETRSGTRSNTETGSGSNSENETVGESLHTRRTGNIGVTTTQQMIREERDVVTFSTIKYITESFKKHFCLLVY